eukprot:EG_transcript_27186
MLPSNCRARPVDRLGNFIEAESLLIWCNFAILPSVVLCAGYDVAATPIALLLTAVANCGRNAFPHVRALAHADRLATLATLACDAFMFLSAVEGVRQAIALLGTVLLVVSVAWHLRQPLRSAAVDAAVWRLLMYLATCTWQPTPVVSFFRGWVQNASTSGNPAFSIPPKSFVL